MLRCASPRSLTRTLQTSSRRSLVRLQNTAEKPCYQTRLLSFLPIGSSLDTAQKISSRENGLDKHLAIQSPDGIVNPDQSAWGLRNDTSSEISDAENPAHLGHYSATLADGTIVHNGLRPITRSHFGDLVSMISQIWDQHSLKIIPQLSAQNIGIQVWAHLDDSSHLVTRIYDIEIGGGPRRTLLYRWSVGVKDPRFLILESRHDPRGWRSIRKPLMKALENHIGFVDQHASSITLSPPGPHALYSPFMDLQRIFAYDTRDEVLRTSVALDDSTVIIPAPTTVIDPGRFLSLVTIIWQWWRQEQGSQGEASESTTLIRIIEANVAENVFRVEVWRMSRVPDKSLARSVYQILFSDVNGLFVSSCIECQDKMDNLRSGTDFRLRQHARSCLKNMLGCLDSAGNLVKGEYPKYLSLIDGLKLKIWPASGSQSFSVLKTPMVPGSEVAAESERPKLDADTREEEAAASASDRTGSTKNATDAISQIRDNGSPALTKDLSVYVSATLHDGTLAVPSLRLCEQMSIGVGKSFSDFLRIISQWRAQTNQNHEQRGMNSLIYIFSKPSTDSFNIGVLRREDSWFEQPMIRYKLCHTPETSNSQYVKSESLDDLGYTDIQLSEWKGLLVRTVTRGLKNHVGTVGEAGTLRLSEQPTAHPARHDFQTTLTDARRERRKDNKTFKARCKSWNPKDDRQAEKVPQEIPKISMHEQIASTMRLAGALYEVSTMLNEEISNAPAEIEDDISLNQTNSDLIKEANPVVETMKNGEIDIDAVQGAIAEFKTRLQDHKDKILAHVYRRWKEELETRYPLMKRKSAPHNDVDNTASQHDGTPNTMDFATKTYILGRSDKRESHEKARYTPPSLQSQLEWDEKPKRLESLITRGHAIKNKSGQQKSPVKVRYMGPRSDSTPTTTRNDPQENSEWSPVKLRYMDDNEVVPMTIPSDPKQNDQSIKPQGKLSDERPGEQPRSHLSGSRKNDRNEDDGFSIFAL